MHTSKANPYGLPYIIGVYLIPTLVIDNKKNMDYVGITSRKSKACLAEHVVDIKLNRNLTAISRLYQKQSILIVF